MTEMTTKPADSPNLRSQIPAQVHPHGRGKYAATVSYNDGLVAISIRYVEHPLLPLALFGRVIQTKLVRIGGESVRESTLTNDADGLWCTVARGDSPGERISLLSGEWPSSLREAVRGEVNSALHQKAVGFSISLRGKTATVAGLFLVYVIVTGLPGTRQPVSAASSAGGQGSGAPALQAPAAPELSLGEAAGMSSAGIAQAAADAQATPLPIKSALANASFITLRAASAGGKSLVIWSDPLCPHCRDFDQKILAKLPASLGVNVIPVSFKHGSRPLVSYAACAGTAPERAARWKNLMSEQPTGLDVSQQCDAGPAIADANSSLFARAGLRATPTLMKPDGQIFEGDLSSAEAITNWLEK
jgi:hypothetical protein